MKYVFTIASILWYTHSHASPLHIDIALEHKATTYGWGEFYCGDIGKPRPCNKGAKTASGEPFHPHEIASAAVPAPTKTRIRAQWVGLKLKNVSNAPCIKVRLNDKANPRWIGRRGLDLSPAAVRELTQGMPFPHWSGKIEQCKP